MESILDFEKQYYSYYKMYEKDFFSIEEYLAIDVDNYHAYSVYYGKLLQGICSEIDSLMRDISSVLAPEKKIKNITDYCEIIQKNFLNFNHEKVCLYGHNISLLPWDGWDIENDDKSQKRCTRPEWWDIYNLIKHHRAEQNTDRGKENYKLANQINVLNALAALYILEQYTIYAYCKDDLSKSERIFLSCQSKKMQLSKWSGCYTYFSGYYHFDTERLNKVINEKDNDKG